MFLEKLKPKIDTPNRWTLVVLPLFTLKNPEYESVDAWRVGESV
jgi:hypothetical protein